jgi:hypothetical protein
MYIQGNPEYPGLLWNALQSILERANFDRLFLFDCCYAAALTKGSNEYTMEFLTSSRREVISQGPKWSPYVDMLAHLSLKPSSSISSKEYNYPMAYSSGGEEI